jgi:DNA polymerase-3 subunit alpha
MPAPFVHLHCHTDYSLLDGACEISQLMALAEARKMPAIAMTDHGNLFGAVEFYNAAASRGIHPVIGCEAYVAQQSHTVKTDANRYNHLVLLCQNQEGYRNLIQLVSTGFLDGFYYKPRIDKDLLARHSKGLIALSACLRGDISETLLADRYADAKRLAYEYSDIFGAGNFFLEMQDHGLDPDARVLPLVHRLSADTGIPLVVTNDSHYLRQEDARAHEILLCIQTGKTLSDPGRMRFERPAFYLKSGEEMRAMFGEVEHALDRTWEIAQRCQLRLDPVAERFPDFPIPQGHTTDTYFEYVARQGFEKRRGRLEARAALGRLKRPLAEYAERLDREIQMIQRTRLAGYLLIVWDFIRFAREKGIPVGPGRGSATGSLVCYAMEITDIDPLEYGLLFERFLNAERISMPDIDVDFCTRGRGQVIQYVTEKYGREQVAQIITFGTLGARAAIKDVGRVLDMGFADVDRITKLIPAMPLNIKLRDARRMEPQLDEMARKEPRVGEVLEVAERLEGMARNASVHAAGVVISPAPLRELVPLYKTSKDEIVTQYDMLGLEKLGLLKIDFLGLTALTIIDDALKLIQRHRGETLRVEDLPLDDQATFQSVFCKGYTSGVFQFESSGMRDVLRRYQPDRLDDLIALNALYRPGPMDMIDDFIERKHGRRKVVYDLPGLKDILEESYGVIVYQEQVIQISSRLAGYSMGEADLLRRAMGKKMPEEMARQRERFFAGAKALGHPRGKIERIFDQMAKFAGYGFNKSHSAAYAYLAYVIAYLKAHYPVEFMSALLTSETGNTAKVVKYIGECREMGIAVLPPHVNGSDFTFTPASPGTEQAAIRFGLGAIRNVGQGAVEKITAARESGGPFTSLNDFCERVDLAAVNRRMIESFIKAGALDSLGATRAQLMAMLDSAMESGARVWRNRASGQSDLFAGMEGPAAPERPLPQLPGWTSAQTLAGEKEVLGLYISGHPLDEFPDKARELTTHSTSGLEGLAKNTEVVLCGILTGIQRRRNKEGRPWAALQIEDREGAADAMVFSTQYERLLPVLQEERVVVVRGLVLPEENAPPKISVQDIVPMENARLDLPSLISIRVPMNGSGGDQAAALQELFARKPGPTEVRLRLEKTRDFSVILDLASRVRPDREFCAEVARICGPEAVEVLAQ